MLEVCKVFKKDRKTSILDKVSFVVDEGVIYGIFGKSNTFNTVLTRIISGISVPNSGKILIDGIDLYKDLNIAKKMIGYVPYKFGRYNDLKVWEFLEFYYGLYRNRSGNRENDINRVLSIVESEKLKDKFIDELSREERKSICIARSLLNDPKVLILDNPFFGLDEKSKNNIKDIIKKIHSLHKTIIISGDNFHELTKICMAAGVLDNGKMYLQGSITDVMRELFNEGKNIVRIDITKRTNVLVDILQKEVKVEGLIVVNDYIEFVYEGTDEELSRFLKEMMRSDLEITSFSKIKNHSK